MTGSVLLTGANGSLAIPMVKYLLDAYPDFTLILTVRDDSEADKNTAELQEVVAGHSDAVTSIRKLDLASLKEVETFCNDLRSEIGNGKLPRLSAIICNAMSWRLSGGPSYTGDGYETIMAINHLAHFSLSLRLINSMDAQRGRFVFLGSEAHHPLRAAFSKGYPTAIYSDLDLHVHPEPDKPEEELGRGFQRYGTSKLVTVMVAYELNRRLKQNKDTESIRVVTIDPQNLIDSKTFMRSHVPMFIKVLMTIGSWLLPLLRLFQPALASVQQAAKPVVDLAVADEYAGQEGYFEGNAKVGSSFYSLIESVQGMLWAKSVEWCGLRAEDSVIEL
ncbi:hypothetical protein HBI71_182810 [Parastagonospora nodorum]|nr:hypothetical protein HBI71_182810 [Parastagonospora nodorum]